MKRTFIMAAAVAAIALGSPSSSFAQGVGVQVGPVGAGITFEPEQRTRIKEYVVKERVGPVTVKERLAVGAKLPADVELRTVPADWALRFPSTATFTRITGSISSSLQVAKW